MTCLICGSDDDGICRNPKRDEDDQHKVWRGAFYDTTYGQDQIARAAIFNSAKQFLLSIGCSELKWTVRYDGSDRRFRLRDDHLRPHLQGQKVHAQSMLPPAL